MSLSGSMVQETQHLHWNQWSEMKTGMFTSVDSDEPLQPPFKLRNSK